MRRLTISAAQGRNGRPSLNPEPLSRNDAGAISSRDTFAGGAAGRGALAVSPPPRKLAGVWSAGVRTICQIPERSVLPSGVRGAAASNTADRVERFLDPAFDCFFENLDRFRKG